MAEDVPIFQTTVMENPNPEGSARLVRLVRARSEQGKEQPRRNVPVVACSPSEY
jgi:hypothetical protein